jgi:5-methylcytosine-specific restriction endonuclease McrA
MYVGRDTDALSFRELEDELATLAAHLYAGTCRWLELVAELDRRGEVSGCTCAQWLAWRCGLTPRTAREHVRIARRLGELPLIRAAFGAGELSYAKVRALTRIAEPETEEELLGLARELTAAQLERAVRAYRRVTTEEADAVQAAAYVDWYWDEDGSLVLRGRLAPEDGAVLLQALEAARDGLRVRAGEIEGGSAEPPPTNAEALAAVADSALSVAGAGRSGGERHQVVVHVDETALVGAGDGGCELADGPALAPETARRLACDSSVVRVTDRGDRTLSVGRKTRSVPSALRRALRRRDRGCRFPGCENQRFVDAHHVRHWAHGGETRLDNLVLLCRRHHRLVHEGGYSIERLPGDRLRFRDPRGGPIPAVPQPPAGYPDRLLEGNRPLAIDAGTYESGAADRMDLDLAVEALLAIQQLPRDALPDRGDETRLVPAPVRFG